MSTRLQIEAALSELTAEELFHIETVLRQIRRARGKGILMDDDYGLWTEEDQLSAAAEAFAVMDEAKPA
jgi:hypothetical protein